MEGADGSANGVDVPHEDAGVPIVVACGEVVLGGGEVGLLLEGFYLIYLVHVREVGCGDVAIACFGAAGLDANGHDGFFVGSIVQSLAEDALIFDCVDDQGIGWCHHDVGIGVLLQDFPTSIGDAGGGIACLWFGENIVYRHVRYLLLDDADVFLVGDHPHILYRTDRFQSVNGELYEGTSHAHHVNELLGVVGGGHGPKATANAASHYDDLCTTQHFVYDKLFVITC